MKIGMRCICLVLVLSFLMVMPVSAQTEGDTRASLFFAAHETYLEKISETRFKIWYDVSAVDIMDKLGVCEIEVDRSSDGINWELVSVYEDTFYPAMIVSNTGSHSGYITCYNASPGCYYRAYVTFYAKDSRGTGELSRMTKTLYMG